MIRIVLALALLLSASAVASAQVRQSGNVTPGHVAKWTTTGIISDGGTAASGGITSLGVTASGSGICQNSDDIGAAGYQQICIGATTSGGGFLSVQNFGTATAQPFNLIVNGTQASVPTAQGPFVANDAACFLNTGGTIIDCGLKIVAGTVTSGAWGGTPIAVTFGGTGATTAGNARSNLGLGSISTQNSNAVAITGGTITGMPNPTVSSDVANKAYVDATSAGLKILAPSTLATAAVLPNTPTYANGASGVGATLTAGSNTTLTVDGTAAPLNTVVLVKNQASALQNGIYTVTTAGSGAAPWVLTRATYFDQAAEMTAGSYTLITSGVTNANASFVLATTVATVGSDAVTFFQFSGSTTTSISLAPAANYGFSLIASSAQVFPVPTFYPTTVDKTLAVDIVPNGSPSEISNQGFAWLDITDKDVYGNPSVALRVAHVGITSTAAVFGSKVYNGGGTTPVHIEVDGTNRVTIDSTGISFLSNPLPVSIGGTGDTGSAWTAYVPTVSSATGSCTSCSATGRYKTLGKTVWFSQQITITTNGSAASQIRTTLPPGLTPQTGFSASGGRSDATGPTLWALGVAGVGTLFIARYDGVYPGVDGATFSISGTYESQ